MAVDRVTARTRLQRVAFGQAGYFTAAQAVAAGFSYQAQKYHRDRGNWLQIDRGLYRLPGWPSTPEDVWACWCTWAGPDSAVSHESALTVHDLSDANPAVVHLTVPPDYPRRRVPVTLHRAPLPPDDVEPRGAYRVTTVVRTLLDVAVGTTPQEILDGAVADAVGRGAVTVDQIWQHVGGSDDRLSWRLTHALEVPEVTRELASFDARGLRTSLDQRLLAAVAGTGLDVDRLRRHLVFHRILARMAALGGWVLKGGFALGVRLPNRARATRDVDVSIHEDADIADVARAVSRVLALDLGDHFRSTPDGAALTVTTRTPRRGSRWSPTSVAASSQRSSWTSAQGGGRPCGDRGLETTMIEPVTAECRRRRPVRPGAASARTG
ncbi:MAG: nucleotidyl transferase AbiEii/AbiGii toxin family protein [Kineosporiaceae bacterium]